MKLLTLITLFFTLPCLAQKAAVITEYIANNQQYAIEEQVRTGIPASITMAQAIHESGAGQGELAIKSNNHFGIKCKSSWTGAKVYHNDDQSGECFRAYACVADSYRDHSDFLVAGKRYSFLFELDPTDYSAWATGLKQAGYATNPKYPQILQRIIEDNNLELLTEMALQKNTNGNIWLASNKTTNNGPAATNATATLPIIENKQEKTTGNPQLNIAQQAIFKINRCRAIFAPAGTSLRKIAVQYNIDYNDLLQFNDMKPVEKLADNQLLFLEEKRKKGNNKVHVVQKGESLWLISQQEGIRLNKLLAHNSLSPDSKLLDGQQLKLR